MCPARSGITRALIGKECNGMANMHYLVGKRRAIASALVVSLLFSLTACKKNTKKNEFESGREILETDPYFDSKLNEFKIPLDPDKKVMFKVVEDYEYVGGFAVATYNVEYEMPEEMKHRELTDQEWAEYRVRVTALFDSEGNLISKIDEDAYHEAPEELTDEDYMSITSEEDTLKYRSNYRLCAMDTDGNGNIYLMLRYYDGYNMMDGFEVRVLDGKGEVQRVIDLSDPPTDLYDGGTEEIFDPNVGETEVNQIRTKMTMLLLDDGNICIGGSEHIAVYDGINGGKLCEFDDASHTFVGGLFMNKGKYCVVTKNVSYSNPEDVTLQVKEVDLKTGKLSAGTDANALLAYDQIITNSSGIFVDTFNGCLKYDPDTGKFEEIFSWNYTDVDRSILAMSKTTPVSDNELCVIACDQYDNLKGPYLIHLTRAEKNPHAGKKIIVVGGKHLSESGILPVVNKFNSDPEKNVRVALLDYVEGSDDDNGALEQRIYLDLISGSGPDVIVNMGDYEALRNGSVMEDLNQYIDGENGIKREEYFDNILRAFEKDGKLYHLPVEFYLTGLYVNSDLLPYTDGWTYDEFIESARNLAGQDKAVSKSMLQNDLLYYFLSTSISRFVDYEKHTVDFENDDMRKILEATKEFAVERIPSEEKYKVDNYTFGNEGEDGFVTGSYATDLSRERFVNGITGSWETLLYNVTMIGQLREMRIGHGVFLGFPSYEKKSMAVGSDLSMGISSLSKYKDLAWEFIKAYIEMEGDDAAGRGGLPLKRSAFAEECRYDMETANKTHTEFVEENPYLIGMIPYYPEVKQEDIDTLTSLAEKADTQISDDEAVFNIIAEEAAGYFAGDRTIDDVLKNIQNRTKIIVQEY